MSQAAISVCCHVDPLVPQLWCDGAKMKQVLLNLVLNAVQAMPEGGVLTSQPPCYLDICKRSRMRNSPSPIRESIPPEVQSRVFDPFFTTKDDGTGLGLAIVHALVEAHHGRIDVMSSPGCGTSFVITLPQECSQLPASPFAAAAWARQAGIHDDSLTVAKEEMSE